MSMIPQTDDDVGTDEEAYRLEQQIGFVLRKVTQRHLAIFSKEMPNNLTPTQFSLMVKLLEIGQCSQNYLGRQIAVDVVTTKGVVSRLKQAGYVAVALDPKDKRRFILSLTALGREVSEQSIPIAKHITEQSLAPLDAEERVQLLALLSKIT